MRTSTLDHVKRIFLALALIGAGTSHAATYVVNTLDIDLPDTNTALAGCDANPVQAGDQCTLRAAVMQANAQPGADVIVIPLNADITLTIPGDGDASVGDLNLSADVIITSITFGAPADANDYQTITSDGSGRIFRVENNAQVELRGMQLIGGIAPALSFGGALASLVGTQTVVDRVRFLENSAYAAGAVANWGLMTIEDSDFLLNASGAPGAAIYNDGILTLRRSSIRRSRSVQLSHAAIYLDAQSLTTIENTLVDGNDSGAGSTDTGGIYAHRPSALIVRNSTLVDFTDSALIASVNDDSMLRLYNSVLVGNAGSDDCAIDVVPGTSPDILVDYSTIPIDSDCHDYHDHHTLQVQSSSLLDLDGITGEQHSFVRHRIPLLNSYLVDSGRPEGLGGESAAQCIGSDQIGNLRPQDGDADGEARCDMGAIEAATQSSSTFLVNWYTQDLPDASPGDDICDAELGSAGEQCTLRAAVMEANAKPGPDIIEFQPDPNNDDTLTLTRGGIGGALWGDLDITEQLRIEGNLEHGRPITRIVGDMSDRLFDVALPPGHSTWFHNLVMSGGESSGYGGALRAMSGRYINLDTLEIASNSATLGGGAIYSQAESLYAVQLDLHHNSAPTDAAGILARGRLNLFRSSLWNNITSDAGQGEVIYIDDNGSSQHTIGNVTITGNSGGILADQVDELRLTYATVVDNDDHGLRATNGGTIRLRGSILSGNQHVDCQLEAGVNLVEAEYNLVNDASCAVGGSNSNASPLLAPAAWRPDGQITRVRLPMPGSPAIDAIPKGAADGLCESLGSDQLGAYRRPVDSDSDGMQACEIGALELPFGGSDPAQFVVNVVDEDRVDPNPGDGSCDIDLGLPGQQCTLRAAVMESNLLSGHNHISFEAAGTEVLLTRAPGGALNDASTGDLDILDALTIEGFADAPASRPHLVASHSDRIFNVNAAGDSVSMSDLILSGGNTTGSGGAIRFANVGSGYLLRLRMDANTAEQGGGAISLLNGSLILDRSDLDNNAALGNGGAIRSEGDLGILASSIRSNLDFDAAGSRQAIHVSSGGITSIHNSTISDNAGMGVDIADGTLSASSSTIAGNSGHGIRFERIGGETLHLRHLLLNGNGDGGCQMNGAGAATISTNGYNLSQSYGCDIQSGGSNVVTGEVGLLPLVILPEVYSAFHLLGPGSVAIDSGSLITGGGGGCEADDQHGITRPVDGDADGSARCDAGAIEMAAWPDEIFSNGFED